MKKLQNFRCMLGVGVVLLLCVVCFGTTKEANAAIYSGECGKNLTWEYDDTTKTFTISGTGTMYTYFTSGERPWFEFRREIEKGVIGEGVISLSSGTFSGCTNLTSVELPDSLQKITSSAFDGCSKLTSIELPDNLTEIGYMAFKDCSGLKSIELPDGLTTLGYGAFQGCSSLESIDIPSSVTSIGGQAFTRCRLTSIRIPDGVKSIDSSTFMGCSRLKFVEIPNSVTNIGFQAFYGCSNLEMIDLPDSVTSIGRLAFYGCSNLKEIKIPDSVTSIGEKAFTYCSRLKTITLTCNWRPDIESSDFYGAKSISTVNYNHLGSINTCTDDINDTISMACSACGDLGAITLCAPDVEEKIFYDGTVKTVQYKGEILGETPEITYIGAAATNGEAVNAGTYTATMTVGGQRVSVQFVIEKLEWAPNAPQKTVTVPYTMTKVKDVALPENWEWQESYTDRELIVGEVTEGTAVYRGADQGNYKNEAIIVEITRAACVHEGGVATCVEKATCNVCGVQYGEVDSANHGDTELKNVAEATCTENGYTGDTCCKECGVVLEQGKAIEAKGHVGGTATCVEKATCEVCGEKYNEVDATNHGEKGVKNAIEETCTETGYTGDTCCKDCGFVFTAGENVAAKGHNYSSAVTKEPTIKETGVLTYTCVHCGDTYTEVIEKLPDPAKGVVAEVTYATYWGNGGQVEITLTNGGEDMIDGWNIELDLNITGVLTNSWGDGYVTSFKDGHVTITNQDWVQNFEAGTTKKVYMQYNGSLPGFVTCDQNGDALVASINYLNHWGNGGQIEILLENTGVVLNGGWGTELTINLLGTMTGTWGDGYVSSFENGHIVIKNQDWVKGFENGTKKSIWLQFDGVLPVEAFDVVVK